VAALRYREQNSPLTLAEGVAEYSRSLPERIQAHDVSLREYIAYLKEPEVNGLLAEISYSKVAVESVKAIPNFYRAYKHARRMTKKWPFWGSDAYLGRPIVEIRRELGIEVVPIP
jgi:hypothetical protein